MEVGFANNRKTARLVARCGADGLLGLLRLFEYTTRNRPSGNLSGLSDAKITDICEWDGEGNFAATLATIGWLDGAENEREVHEWEDHQPFASKATERQKTASLGGKARSERMTPEQKSEHARKMANARHASSEQAECLPVLTDSKHDACDLLTDACSYPILSLPIQIPPMSPNGKQSPESLAGSDTHMDEPTVLLDVRPTPKPDFDKEFETVFWPAWPVGHKKCGEDARKAFIKARRDGFTLDVIMAGLAKAVTSYEFLKDGGNFMPHGATWLNGKRWKDDYTPWDKRPQNGINGHGRASPPIEGRSIKLSEFNARNQKTT
jgi:hypothetical protein